MPSIRVRRAQHLDGDSRIFHELRPPRAVAILGPLATRLSGWSASARTLLLIEVVAAFVLACGVLYVRFGPAVSLLSVLPVAIAGMLLGTRDGVRSALLVGIVNVLLYEIVGRWDDALRTSLPALIILIPVGLIFGALRDLSVWIHLQASELVRRQRAMDSDVVERQSTELALTLRARQQLAVATLGHSALEGADLGTLLQEAIDAIFATLEVEHCAAWELVSGGDALIRVGGLAPPEGLPLQQLQQTARTGEPCFVLAPVNGLVVQIAGLGRPFGVLTASIGAERAFSNGDVHFMQTVANIVGTAIQRAWAEAAVAREASHDALTGLPNRTLFRTRLNQALGQGCAKHESVGVMFLDLDNFKWINDGLGHTVGDQVLVAVGTALRSAVRSQDTAARLGGDEFTVLLRTPVDRTIITQIAQRLIERLAQPLDLNGQEVSVTPSIGIALSDPSLGSGQAEDLLRQADTAMYAAKMRGKARYSFFEAGQETDDLLPLELGAHLHRALERGELRLHYQPIIELDSGRMVEVEALLRWEHPQRGLLQPVRFVPLAEQTGLIIPIGRWVLEEACRQTRAWKLKYPDLADLVVAVNVSGRQAIELTLVEDVQRALKLATLRPEYLRLELTETEAIVDRTPALAELARQGVRLAIDDFGTGYASMSYLKRFPADSVKIDRSFIDGLGVDEDDTAIVRSIVALAGALRRACVAEGIETAEQLAVLRDLGCERGQGYYLAPPMSPGVLEQWVEATAAVDQAA